MGDVRANQRKAIEALLTTGSATDAADAAGVGRSTLYRWLKEPDFIEALREAESEAIAALSRTLAGLGESAAQALRDALAPTEKTSDRLRAAEIVIGNLLRLRELVDLGQRTQEIEERLDRLDEQAD